jgi:K+-sensing histidine kinase KdpD
VHAAWRGKGSPMRAHQPMVGAMSTGTEPGPPPAPKAGHWRWITPITVSLALVALTTALLWVFDAQLDQQHLIFVYFVPTALIAIRYGSLSAMCVTIASSLAAAYFLYPPQFSFLVGSSLDILELTLFCLLALLASQVVSGFANDGDVARRRRPSLAYAFLTKWPAMTALLSRGRDRS